MVVKSSRFEHYWLTRYRRKKLGNNPTFPSCRSRHRGPASWSIIRVSRTCARSMMGIACKLWQARKYCKSMFLDSIWVHGKNQRLRQKAFDMPRIMAMMIRAVTKAKHFHNTILHIEHSLPSHLFHPIKVTTLKKGEKASRTSLLFHVWFLFSVQSIIQKAEESSYLTFLSLFWDGRVRSAHSHKQWLHARMKRKIYSGKSEKLVL